MEVTIKEEFRIDNSQDQQLNLQIKCGEIYYFSEQKELSIVCNICNTEKFQNFDVFANHFVQCSSLPLLPNPSYVYNTQFEDRNSMNTNITSKHVPKMNLSQTVSVGKSNYEIIPIDDDTHTIKDPLNLQNNSQNSSDEFIERYIPKKRQNYPHRRLAQYKDLFGCEVCGKHFNSRSLLTRHSKVHSDERPYQCNMCDKNFKYSQYLKDHILMHKGEKQKPWKCKLCDKTFSRGTSARLHYNNVCSKKEKFNCPLCNIKLASQVSLENHIAVFHTS